MSLVHSQGCAALKNLVKADSNKFKVADAGGKAVIEDCMQTHDNNRRLCEDGAFVVKQLAGLRLDEFHEVRPSSASQVSMAEPYCTWHLPVPLSGPTLRQQQYFPPLSVNKQCRPFPSANPNQCVHPVGGVVGTPPRTLPPKPPPPPKGAPGQRLVGGVVGIQNQGDPPRVLGALLSSDHLWWMVNGLQSVP